METQAPKDLAKEIYAINWEAVQVDCIHENENVRRLFQELKKYPAEEALKILLKVLEATQLKLRFDAIPEFNPFKDLADFENIEQSFKKWNADKPYR